MAYTTNNATTTTKSTIFDKSTDDGLGPLEWTIETDQDVDIFFTGIFPGAANPVRLLAGDSRPFGSPGRGVTKIEAQNVSQNGTVKLFPSVS